MHKSKDCDVFGCTECQRQRELNVLLRERGKPQGEALDHLMKKNLTTSTRDAPSLNFSELLKAKNLMDRYSNIYFMACNSLPDDCYGIIYVRSEDMPNQPKGGE